MARAKKAPTRKKVPSKTRPTAKKRGARSRRGNVITVDFTDVESGGAMPTPDGPYTAVLSHAEQTVSSNGNDMIEVRWKTNIGSTIFDNFTLVPQALWVLRTMLECAGYDIPDAEYDLDVDALIDVEVGLDIVNEEYESKDRPKIAGYMPLEVAEEVMGKLRADPEDEPEDDEPEDDEPEDDEDEDEPEDDEDEDEDEEEEPAPKRKSKAKTKAKKAATKKKKAGALRPGARVVFEDDGEEIQGVIEFIEDGEATVIDDEESEWEIPVAELTKA
jgi:hypothetical protein